MPSQPSQAPSNKLSENIKLAKCFGRSGGNIFRAVQEGRLFSLCVMIICTEILITLSSKEKKERSRLATEEFVSTRKERKQFLRVVKITDECQIEAACKFYIWNRKSKICNQIFLLCLFLNECECLSYNLLGSKQLIKRQKMGRGRGLYIYIIYY